MFEAKDRSKPHRACVVQHNIIVDDDTLLQGELFCAASLMAGRIYWEYNQEEGISANRVFPVSCCAVSCNFGLRLIQLDIQVIVYSLTGYEARIVQAYYDTTKKLFIVRKTKHFPVRNRVNEGAYQMMRWILHEPCGDTKVDPL